MGNTRVFYMEQWLKKKKKATTISLVTTNGPSINTIVNPAPKLVNNGNDQPAYLGKK